MSLAPVASPADDSLATLAPDRAPTAEALDALATFDAADASKGPVAGRAPEADGAEPDAPPAGWLSRLRGHPHRTIGALVAGGILVGASASATVAWKVIGSRNAEVASGTIRSDAPSSQIDAQAEKIEVPVHALAERPIPQPAAAPRPDDAPATAAAPAAPVGSFAPVAAAPRQTPEAPVRLPTAAAGRPGPDLPRRPERPASTPAGLPPSQAGSGICDVPGGTDGPARMRQCIEWFAGRDATPARQPR
jgi:pyruvate dehydrogenase E2 component (dihydrolipoamide acetyltransferase)